MTTEDLSLLAMEIRKEYQIPSFYQDDSLKNLIRESEAYLNTYCMNTNINSDQEFRMLLKTRVFYAFHHKIDEWEDNYRASRLHWQLTAEVKK